MTSSNRPTPTRTRFVVIVRDRSGEEIATADTDLIGVTDVGVDGKVLVGLDGVRTDGELAVLDLASGDVMFACTGVTDGPMLKGVRRFAWTVPEDMDLIGPLALRLIGVARTRLIPAVHAAPAVVVPDDLAELDLDRQPERELVGAGR